MASTSSSHALDDYEAKRDFQSTPEPRGASPSGRDEPLQFVIQKHAARRLHYDLRLEMEGVLRSWAVPKGPHLDPSVRSLAVHVEDHPIEYGSFEGTIPEGNYGAGTVMLWDRGIWHPEGDPVEMYERGRIKARFEGEKLRGRWILFRMSGEAGEGGKNWLLQKVDDEEARPEEEYVLVEEEPLSIASGRSMDEITDAGDAVWTASPQDEAAPPTADVPGDALETLPDPIEPQLATAVKEAPQEKEWLHELKLDGYRLLLRAEAGRVRLITRNDNDWTDRFPTIAEAADPLPDGTVLDGEVVVLRPDGTSDFQALQNAIKGGSERLVFFAFDLLFYDFHDLRPMPLVERKKYLERVLSPFDTEEAIRFSDHIDGHGEGVYRHACQHALEGIISKRRDAPYVSGRTTDWLKTKCLHRQEFVVGGWTDPSGSRVGLGALLLGYHDEHGRLRYAGRVGTGFTDEMLSDLHDLLRALERDAAAYHDPPTGQEAKGVHWADPELIAEVEFTSWTNDRRVRHASFVGLREDKEPHQVAIELPPESATTPHGTMNDSPSTVAGISLSNPDRILYPEQGLTKGALARYLDEVSEWLLPHVEDRPLTLVRCPKGRDEKCFYQKHLREGMPEAIRGVEVDEEDETAIYASVRDAAGLVALAQMGVLEIHPWGSRADRLDRPDRLIFDLDPGAGVGWKEVVEAARRTGNRLEGLGLESFVRTSGGKGLHVVVPLVRRSSWEEAKAFSRGIAQDLARAEPERYVATSSKAKRGGRIFIDYLRNTRGATAVASYSPRARPNAPVATPLRWEELTGLESAARYTVSNVRRRLGALEEDPWAGFFDVRQSLTKAMREAVSTP